MDVDDGGEVGLGVGGLIGVCVTRRPGGHDHYRRDQ